jgi:hypothetical protein
MLAYGMMAAATGASTPRPGSRCSPPQRHRLPFSLFSPNNDRVMRPIDALDDEADQPGAVELLSGRDRRSLEADGMLMCKLLPAACAFYEPSRTIKARAIDNTRYCSGLPAASGTTAAAAIVQVAVSGR